MGRQSWMGRDEPWAGVAKGAGLLRSQYVVRSSSSLVQRISFGVKTTTQRLMGWAGLAGISAAATKVDSPHSTRTVTQAEQQLDDRRPSIVDPSPALRI